MPTSPKLVRATLARGRRGLPRARSLGKRWRGHEGTKWLDDKGPKQRKETHRIHVRLEWRMAMVELVGWITNEWGELAGWAFFPEALIFFFFLGGGGLEGTKWDSFLSFLTLLVLFLKSNSEKKNRLLIIYLFYSESILKNRIREFENWNHLYYQTGFSSFFYFGEQN